MQDSVYASLEKGRLSDALLHWARDGVHAQLAKLLVDPWKVLPGAGVATHCRLELSSAMACAVSS